MDINEAYANLERAHASGNTAEAQRFADAIRAEQAKIPKDSISPVAVHPGEAVAEMASGWNPASWFQSQDPKETSLQEAAGKVGGGAVAGAAGGAILPGLLRGLGKVIPGAAGKLAKTLGEGMGALPVKERMIKGAGGGAAMGTVDALGDALGAPKALTAAAGLVGGGVGESAASFLTKETGALLRFAGNLSYGNVAGASRAFGGMLSPNKALNEATAKKLQQKLFGERTDGYVNGLVGSDNRIAAQEAMRKADPSLLSGPRAGAPTTRPQWETSTGEMMPMSAERGLATVGQKSPAGAFDVPGQAPLAIAGPAGALPAKPAPIPGMAAGKAGARAKLTAAQEAQAKAEAAAAEASMKPASQLYRERMYQGVTEGVKSGKTFSTTPEFAEFQKAVEHQVTMGGLGKTEAAELMRKLRLDRAKGEKNGKVLEGYAELVDNEIRRFGKPAEGSFGTGAAVIDKKVSADLREALQGSFNKYTQRLGMGSLEKQYRGAYSKEMLAEAKDKLPHFLYKGFGQEKEFAKMARNLARDPEGKPFIQQVLAKHLANQEPKALVSEFDRLQSTLVNAKLIDPADLKQLRTGVEVVRKTAEKGLQQKRSETLKQLMLMAMTRQAGVEGGGAANRQEEVVEE